MRHQWTTTALHLISTVPAMVQYPATAEFLEKYTDLLYSFQATAKCSLECLDECFSVLNIECDIDPGIDDRVDPS